MDKHLQQFSLAYVISERSGEDEKYKHKFSVSTKIASSICNLNRANMSKNRRRKKMSMTAKILSGS